VVVGAVASGCSAGPSQVGSAGIVGDTAIPLGEVQDDIAVALRSDRAEIASQLGLTDPQAVARYVVTDALRHELLADRAAAEGLTVGERDVDAALAAQGPAALFEGERARQAARDQLLAGQLGAREVDRMTVTLDLAVAPSEAEAQTIAQSLAAGDPGVATQPLQIPAAQALGQFPLFPFGTPVGSVVVLEPAQPDQVEVVRITDRTDAPSATPVAAQVPPDLLASFGYQLLQGDAGDVQVNPRYGVFDPLQMAVVAPDDLIGTVLPPVDQPADQR
jgi:hypothetical protein